MKPIIGISVNLSLPNDPSRSFSKGVMVHYIQEHYLQYVEAGGGTPILLAPTSHPDEVAGLISGLHGLMITGGIDVDPSLYGEPNTHSKNCNPVRDRFELALIAEARRRELSLLGICRGIQVLNVAYGGSLIQDIPSTVPGALQHHRWEDGREAFHTLRLDGNSILSELFPADGARINSSHHQSIKAPGAGLKVLGLAGDGVVEAVVSTEDRMVLGIQWHPERMLDDPKQVDLARWFVSTCRV
jgi:putative glutamine amidotransferase